MNRAELIQKVRENPFFTDFNIFDFIDESEADTNGTNSRQG